MVKFVLIVVTAMVASAAIAFPAQQIEELNESPIRVIRSAEPDPLFFGNKFGGGGAGSFASAGTGGGYNGYNPYNRYDPYNPYNRVYYDGPYDGGLYDGYNPYNGYGNGYNPGNNQGYNPGYNSRSKAFSAAVKIPFFSASVSSAKSRTRPAGLLGLIG